MESVFGPKFRVRKFFVPVILRNLVGKVYLKQIKAFSVYNFNWTQIIVSVIEICRKYCKERRKYCWPALPWFPAIFFRPFPSVWFKKGIFWRVDWLLILDQLPNKPLLLLVCSTSLLKTLWRKETLLITSNFFFPTVFSTLLENFQPFSSNSKLLSANSFSLEEPKTCCLVKS